MSSEFKKLFQLYENSPNNIEVWKYKFDHIFGAYLILNHLQNPIKVVGIHDHIFRDCSVFGSTKSGGSSSRPETYDTMASWNCRHEGKVTRICNRRLVPSLLLPLPSNPLKFWISYRKMPNGGYICVRLYIRGAHFEKNFVGFGWVIERPFKSFFSGLESWDFRVQKVRVRFRVRVQNTT